MLISKNVHVWIKSTLTVVVFLASGCSGDDSKAPNAAHYVLEAYYQTQSNDLLMAIETTQEGLRHHPFHDDLAKTLIFLYIRTSQWDELEKYLSVSAIDERRKAVAYYELAAHMHPHDSIKAIRYYRRVANSVGMDCLNEQVGFMSLLVIIATHIDSGDRQSANSIYHDMKEKFYNDCLPNINDERYSRNIKGNQYTLRNVEKLLAEF